ncbi:hypothetical protein GF386_00070 [Candidatus Pacearchaeota archaeon]|nr:hypothetical protein [Candidatus Pacearchaeota archaeon]MBD3282677.1 hypothetical protein [Candidatus Pacearchaeota archaeon]
MKKIGVLLLIVLMIFSFVSAQSYYDYDIGDVRGFEKLQLKNTNPSGTILKTGTYVEEDGGAMKYKQGETEGEFKDLKKGSSAVFRDGELIVADLMVNKGGSVEYRYGNEEKPRKYTNFKDGAEFYFENGELVEADFIVREGEDDETTTYKFGNYEYEFPAGTHVVFRSNKEGEDDRKKEKKGSLDLRISNEDVDRISSEEYKDKKDIKKLYIFPEDQAEIKKPEIIDEDKKGDTQVLFVVKDETLVLEKGVKFKKPDGDDFEQAGLIFDTELGEFYVKKGVVDRIEIGTLAKSDGEEFYDYDTYLLFDKSKSEAKELGKAFIVFYDEDKIAFGAPEGGESASLWFLPGHSRGVEISDNDFLLVQAGSDKMEQSSFVTIEKRAGKINLISADGPFTVYTGQQFAEYVEGYLKAGTVQIESTGIHRRFANQGKDSINFQIRSRDEDGNAYTAKYKEHTWTHDYDYYIFGNNGFARPTNLESIYSRREYIRIREDKIASNTLTTLEKLPRESQIKILGAVGYKGDLNSLLNTHLQNNVDYIIEILRNQVVIGSAAKTFASISGTGSGTGSGTSVGIGPGTGVQIDSGTGQPPTGGTTTVNPPGTTGGTSGGGIIIDPGGPPPAGGTGSSGSGTSTGTSVKGTTTTKTYGKYESKSVKGYDPVDGKQGYFTADAGTWRTWQGTQKINYITIEKLKEISTGKSITVTISEPYACGPCRKQAQNNPSGTIYLTRNQAWQIGWMGQGIPGKVTVKNGRIIQ